MDKKIQVLKGDITSLDVDIIVNAANRTLLGGGGVDGAIHKAAGPELLEECKTLNGCETGDAKITKGYNLKAKHVIHTVGPIWSGGVNNEPELLASCYHKSLRIASKIGIKSIAFPCISTGVYGYPAELANNIALKVITEYLEEDNILDTVVLVCFGDDAYNKMKKTLEKFQPD